MGDPAVGKSALTQMFHSNGQRFPKAYNMTCGIDFSAKAVNIPDTEEAIELHKAAADAFQVAGDEGNAAVARFNLANTLNGLKRHAEARPLLEAVLAFETERHGAEHEHTLKTRYKLAVCMLVMGAAEGAMREKEAVLAAMTRTLGPTNDSTLVARENLAVSYTKAGDHDTAAREFEAVVEARTATAGPRHAATLSLVRRWNWW